MSRKDSLMKEIDEVAERVRFWHNAILTLLAGVAGMLFGMSQGKSDCELYVLVFRYNISKYIGFWYLQIGTIEQRTKNITQRVGEGAII